MKLGVVLSVSGKWGNAHIGVIKALKNNNNKFLKTDVHHLVLGVLTLYLIA